MRTQGYDDNPKWLDSTLDLLEQYRERTGLPVIALSPTGGVMSARGPSAGAADAMAAIAGRGFPLYPSFQRGAEALNRAVSFHEAAES